MAKLDPNLIYQGLLERGMPDHVARGFVTNFKDESGFDPSINEANPIVPGSRGGFGLGQWTGPRRRALEAYGGENAGTMDTQLDFLMSELGGPESKAYKLATATGNVGEAASSLVKNFFRPAAQHRNSRSARYMNNPNGMTLNSAPAAFSPNSLTGPVGGPELQLADVPAGLQGIGDLGSVPPALGGAGGVSSLLGNLAGAPRSGPPAIRPTVTAGVSPTTAPAAVGGNTPGLSMAGGPAGQFPPAPKAPTPIDAFKNGGFKAGMGELAGNKGFGDAIGLLASAFGGGGGDAPVQAPPAGQALAGSEAADAGRMQAASSMMAQLMNKKRQNGMGTPGLSLMG